MTKLIRKSRVEIQNFLTSKGNGVTIIKQVNIELILKKHLKKAEKV